MKILSIDTSSNICSIAILEDLKIIYEYSSNDGLTHSQNLMPFIYNAFNETNLELKDIDLYACSVGPGSFTGIRIGVATTKAFVDVYNKPSIGISSLESLAYNSNYTEYVCSLIDAKHDNVYCRLYKKDSILNGYIPSSDYISDNINSCLLELNKFGNTSITFIGDGSLIYKKNILDNFKNATFADKNQNLQNAIYIGKAAYYRFINHLECPCLSPLYLKKSQAELMLDKRI